MLLLFQVVEINSKFLVKAVNVYTKYEENLLSQCGLCTRPLLQVDVDIYIRYIAHPRAWISKLCKQLGFANPPIIGLCTDCVKKIRRSKYKALRRRLQSLLEYIGKNRGEYPQYPSFSIRGSIEERRPHLQMRFYDIVDNFILGNKS